MCEKNLTEPTMRINDSLRKIVENISKNSANDDDDLSIINDDYSTFSLLQMRQGIPKSKTKDIPSKL